MAYLRARRSIKVAPGFKVNLNKRSAGITVGTRGAHYSVNTSGRRTSTVGLPGSGLSIVNTHGGHRPGRITPPPPQRPPSVAPRGGLGVKHRAGLFASHHERAYASALDRLRKGDLTAAFALLDEVISSDTKHEASAANLIAGLAHYKTGDLDAAIAHLEPVISTHIDPDEDQLLHRYELPDGYAHFDVDIGQLQAPAGAFGEDPVYVLAAAYGRVGRVKEAVGIMQKLVAGQDPGHLQPFPLIILCELYQQLDDWDEIIHLVSDFNVTNVDDGTMVLRSYQAIAMANSGLADAALQVFKDCLKSSKRDQSLLHTIRHARAQIYANTGKKALARKDLSRIYAENPDFPGIEDEIRDLQ